MDSNEVDQILTVDKEDLAAEQDKEITRLFRSVFSTEDGRIVLNQLLIDLRYYSECVSDSDIALNNYAKFMINQRLKINNIKDRTDALIDAGLYKHN